MVNTIATVSTGALLVDGREVRGTYTIHQDWIDVTTQSEEDPNWVHVDSHGHSHRWMAGPDPLVPLRDPHRQNAMLPSLKYVLDPEPHWCELCLGDYQPGHYECVICGDEVSPGNRPTTTRRHIPGLKHIEFDVEKYLSVRDVMVTVPTNPPQTFPGRVTTCSGGSDMNGLWGSSHIVATGPPTQLREQ
jgi:hypothetical protein